MRNPKELFNSMKSGMKIKTRKGFQALARTAAQLRGRTAATAGSSGRKSSRGTGGVHK
jgi:hypothetical protein